MTPRYSIVSDPADTNAVAIIDRCTTEIVERGIVAEGGRCAWLVAKKLRDALNDTSRAGGKDISTARMN